MDRLSGLEKYFSDKDRKKLDRIALDGNKQGMPEMTQAEIKQSCVENGGYETPNLNDKLYLHFKGFKKIENLDEYTGCKAIWLDSNGLGAIEGLEKLTELRCLYLSKNLLPKVQGLFNLKELVVLDLSNNRLRKLENLSCCPNLDSLSVPNNSLTTPESIEHLTECLKLRTLDIQNNKLEADEEFLSVFSKIPLLCTLSVNGNEVTKVQTFRKRTIYMMPLLGFLDRPVEPVERLAAVAFMEHGPQAEKEARAAYRAEVEKERTDRMTSFRTWQKEQVEIRANLPAETRARMQTEDAERKEKREASAHDAHNIEQRAINEVGVGKISGRVTHLEANGYKGNDVVFQAQKELLEELDAEKAAKASCNSRVEELDDSGLPLPPTHDNQDLDALDDDDDEYPVAPPLVKSKEPLSGSIPGFENHLGGKGTLSEPKWSMSSSADEGRQLPEYSQRAVPVPNDDDVVAQQQQATPPPAPEPEPEPVESPEEVAAREAVEAAAKKEKEEKAAAAKKLREEENERQERVAESLAIYKAQKAAAAEAKLAGKTSSDLAPKSSWDSVAAPEATSIANAAIGEGATLPLPADQQVVELDSEDKPVNVTPAGLYWTENMDIILAKQVQACVFDFDRVAGEMVKQFTHDARIDTEACRLRWADLDAGENALETNFTCYVSDQMINQKDKGHGAQPSFDALSTMARSNFPSYLKAPAAFPSVADGDSDDESDGENTNSNVNTKQTAQE